MNILECESFRPNNGIVRRFENREPISIDDNFKIVDVFDEKVKMPIWSICKSCGEIYRFGSCPKVMNKCKECRWIKTKRTAIGTALGGMAGYGLANIMGYGKYKIKKNMFMEGRLPQMTNIPKAGGTVIRFQEYLGDVYTTPDISNPAAFNIQSFLINAANSDTFPWLNQIAQNYEQYNLEGLIFQFRSTSADALNSTNTALGSVMLATQYDVADSVFTTKAEMLNYEYSNSVKPSENCLHMVECAPNQNVLSDLTTGKYRNWQH